MKKVKALWRKKFDFGRDDTLSARLFSAVDAMDDGYLVASGQTGDDNNRSRLYFFLFNGKGKITSQWREQINPLKVIDAVSLHQTPRGLCLVAHGLVTGIRYKDNSFPLLSAYKDTVIRWLDNGDDS